MAVLPEKYGSWPRYLRAWTSRAVLRTALRTAMPRWSRHRSRHAAVDEDGYTLLIGVPWQLWELIEIPLLALRRARREHGRETILVVDTTAAVLAARYGDSAADAVRERYRELNVRVLFYNNWQRAVTRCIGWNWVDCWLTWAIGLDAARTRWVMLHDFDAVVVDPDFVERQYTMARQVGPGAFVGIERDEHHQTGGTREVLATVELMLDVAEIRRRFAPVDLFNRVRRLDDGRRVECDILRDVQLRMDRSRGVLHKLNVEQLVHPSQVVSQWRKLHAAAAHGAAPFAPDRYTPLFIVPYFRYVGGNDQPMRELTRQIASGRRPLDLEGCPLDPARLDAQGVAWIAQQIERLDRYLTGGDPAAPVAAFCRSIRSLVAAAANDKTVSVSPTDSRCAQAHPI